jgi:hypothetical protein
MKGDAAATDRLLDPAAALSEPKVNCASAWLLILSHRVNTRMSDFIKNVLAPFSAVAAAVLAAWVNYSVSQAKSQIEQRQQQVQEKLDTLMTERNVRKLDEDLTFRVYDAVMVSLKSNDEKHQQAATALVDNMVAEPLRTKLLLVFGASQTTVPEVRQAVEKVLKDEQKFNMDSAANRRPKPAAAPAATQALPWHDWDVDIFWCERSGQPARASAEAIVAELERRDAKGRIRARLLPDSINAKPGYRVAGYVIRRDANEAAQADALKGLAQQVVSSSQFEIVTSNQATRWYLSAFVCP